MNWREKVRGRIGLLIYSYREKNSSDIINFVDNDSNIGTESVRILASNRVLSPNEFWKDIDSLIDKQIVIEGNVDSFLSCTLRNCLKDDKCCNRCMGEIAFLNISEKFLLIKGEYNGKNIECGGNECDVKCYPLERGKKYKVNGVLKKDDAAFPPPYRIYLELNNFEQV